MARIKTYKEKEKEAYEDLDYLKQIDRAPNDSSVAKIVSDDIERNKSIEDKTREDTKSYIDETRGLTYRERLAAYAQAGLESIQWPEGWDRNAISTNGRQISIYGKLYDTQIGILVIVKSPSNNIYVRGIKITQNPELDVNAIDILVMQAENTLDASKGILLSDNVDTVSTLRRTKSGIILPD